jgi:hypothetical protein
LPVLPKAIPATAGADNRFISNPVIHAWAMNFINASAMDSLDDLNFMDRHYLVLFCNSATPRIRRSKLENHHFHPIIPL